MSGKGAETLIEQADGEMADATPPIANQIEKESPRLTKIHEKTNANVDRMLKRDPKQFQELSRMQQSGQ